MLRWFVTKEIFQAQNVDIRESPLHGLGVFARESFRPGDIIETAPVILLDSSERDQLRATKLFGYYFLVENDATPVALGLGYSSLYNHAYSANTTYTVLLKDGLIVIKACKDIHAGEELTLNYNGTPDDVTPVYFPPE